MSTQLYARLARKDNTKVVCGMTDCGAHLANVLDLDGPMNIAGLPPWRVLQTLPGWIRGDDSIYTLSKHAAELHKRGETPAFRRRKRAAPDLFLEPVNPTVDLPALIRCHVCGCVQHFDEDRLDLFMPIGPAN